MFRQLCLTLDSLCGKTLALVVTFVIALFIVIGGVLCLALIPSLLSTLFQLQKLAPPDALFEV